MKYQSEEGPDQGWSWVVVFAAFSVSLILAGIYRTFGVLLVELISEFHTTRAAASWPLILSIAVLNLIGIVAGPLGHRFGVRPVTILGSVIAALGFSSCYFATSLTFITIAIGIIFGIGYGLSFTLMPAIVNQYFFKFRATASGIANSGSCFGSVILPNVYEHLIFNYGLRGCFLLTGGIVLQTVISAVLMRPPSWVQKFKPRRVADLNNLDMTCKNSDHIPNLSLKSGNADIKKNPENNISCNVRESNSMNADVSKQGVCLCKLREEKIFFNCIQKNQMNNELIIALDPGFDTKRQFEEQNISENSSVFIQNENVFNTKGELSSVNEMQLQDDLQDINFSNSEHQTSLKTEVKVPLEANSRTYQVMNQGGHAVSSFTKKIKDFSENLKNMNCSTEHGQPNELVMKSEPLPNTNTETLKEEDVDGYANCNLTTNNSVSDSNSKFKTETQRDGNNSGSLENVLQFKSSCERSHPNSSSNKHETYPVKRRHLVNNEIHVLKVDDLKYMPNARKKREHRSDVPIGIIQSFIHVIKMPMFYVTAITNVCFYFLYHMYVVIIIDFLLDRGISQDKAKYILFTFALSDLIGRLSFGWITDSKLLRRSQFVMLCMILMGLVFFCYPFVYEYEYQITISCVYGMLMGSTLVLFPVLLVDYVGMENQEIAMGCVCFFNGVATLIWPFIIGYCRDSLGSYSNMFYVLGAISLVASPLWLLEYFFTKVYNISTMYQSELKKFSCK